MKSKIISNYFYNKNKIKLYETFKLKIHSYIRIVRILYRDHHISKYLYIMIFYIYRLRVEY